MSLLLAADVLYQALKLRAFSVLLAKDAVHVYIGFGCYAATILLLRLPLGSGRALLPGLLVSLGMEALDLRDDWNGGHLHWAASVKDVVNTNLIPCAVVLLARIGRPASFKRAGASRLPRR